MKENQLCQRTMKAAVVRELGKPLTIEDPPVPEPGVGQMRVRIQACGVCHTCTPLARPRRRYQSTPPHGGRSLLPGGLTCNPVFQSTPPHTGGASTSTRPIPPAASFNPRPRTGGAATLVSVQFATAERSASANYRSRSVAAVLRSIGPDVFDCQRATCRIREPRMPSLRAAGSRSVDQRTSGSSKSVVVSMP